MPGLVGGAIACAIGGAGYAGYHFVTTSARFEITQISVQGNRHLSTEQVLAQMPVATGDNVFAADLDGATRALAANPWVAHAEIHRVLPHTLIVELREHDAVAVVELGARYLVEASGHPFKRSDDGEGDDLPLVTGIARDAYGTNPDATARVVVDSLAALATWRGGADRPLAKELHVDDFGRLAIRTGGVEIELGALDASLAARLHTFDAAWAALGDDERARARTIHLDRDHVTVALKDS